MWCGLCSLTQESGRVGRVGSGDSPAPAPVRSSAISPQTDADGTCAFIRFCQELAAKGRQLGKGAI